MISRKQAKAKGLTRYFTGKPCCRGHVAERMVSNYVCVDCANIFPARKRYLASDKHKAAQKRDYTKHKKKRIAQQTAWVTRNLDRVRWNKHQHYLANKDIYILRARINKLG